VVFRDVLYRDVLPVHLVLTWRRRMKEPWFLVTDLDLPAAQVIALCGRQRIDSWFVTSAQFAEKLVGRQAATG
jgi:hypothetical protein